VRRRAAAAARAALLARDGQAVVELLVALPLVAVAALVAASVLVFHATRERAGEAARAGAIALLQDGDAVRAARRAAGAGAVVRVRGRRVTVTVRPPEPLGAVLPRLRAAATADAGPEAAP
jgi:hypothetical protein